MNSQNDTPSPITKLPDGSAFWTADVMTKEDKYFLQLMANSDKIISTMTLRKR